MGQLIFVGLGLTPEDLTVAARHAIETADEVVAEFYTSRLIGVEPDGLAPWLGRPVRILARRQVEEDADRILDAARRHRVAFLTAGDAMTATTHAELRLRAEAAGIPTRIVHGVSIQTAAAGEAGLHSYKFGRSTTLVAPRGDYLPESPFEVLEGNLAQGLHTLVLLDLDVENDRYLLAPEAATLLLRIAARRGSRHVTPATLAVALARVGGPGARVVAAPLGALGALDLGPPLHCLLVPGPLHFTEEEALARRRP